MAVVSARWAQVVGAAGVVFVLGAGSAVTSRAQGTSGGAVSTSGSVLAGVYTDEQAKRGEAISNKLCASCHAPDLTGGEAGPALVGPEFISNWTTLTLGDFSERVHSTMPADSPGSMTPQQTSDVTAFVLKVNKYPAGTVELPTDVGALKGIRIEEPR